MQTDAEVAAKVRLNGERQRYTVQARNDRFVILTKPFNAQRTYLYTIADLERGVRGPCNLIFGLPCDVNTPSGASEALAMIEAGKMDVSSRRCVPLSADDVAALASAPAGDGEYRVNPDRSGLERMTMMDDEMGLHDEPMPPSSNAVPGWHGEAVHKALLSSSEPADMVSDEAIIDLAVETLAREWEKARYPTYADMIRNGGDVYRSRIALRAMVAFAAALARPHAAVGEQSRKAMERAVHESLCRANITAYLDMPEDTPAKIVNAILALQSPPAKVEG